MLLQRAKLLTSFTRYFMLESSISKGEKKHKTEVKLCEIADHVVGVGPKLRQTFRSYFSSCNKDGNVFIWPHSWVFEEFETVKQVSHSFRQKRRVLVFWRRRRFWIKGIWHRWESNCCIKRYSSYVCWGTGWKTRKNVWCSCKSIKSKKICSRPRGFKALTPTSGSCSHAFKNRGLWFNRTRGNVS